RRNRGGIDSQAAGEDLEPSGSRHFFVSAFADPFGLLVAPEKGVVESLQPDPRQRGGGDAVEHWRQRPDLPAPHRPARQAPPVESHEGVEHVEQDRGVPCHDGPGAWAQPSSERAARTANIIASSFARLSATVRVLSPQSGSTQIRSAGRTAVPRRIRLRTSLATSTEWLWTSRTPSERSFVNGSFSNIARRSSALCELARSRLSTGRGGGAGEVGCG